MVYYNPAQFALPSTRLMPAFAFAKAFDAFPGNALEQNPCFCGIAAVAPDGFDGRAPLALILD
jgi:hypothetical protein